MRPELVSLDIAPIIKLSPHDVDRMEADRLEEIASRLSGGFLEDLSLPRDASRPVGIS